MRKIIDYHVSSYAFRLFLTSVAFVTPTISPAAATHDLNFWRSIRAHNFAVPAGESADRLALEICDLAANPDPIVRDECGYEILAAWVYRKNLLSPDQLEPVRQKLLPGMTFRIGESDNETIFHRSFSALYMSVLAAHDLNQPFLSKPAFQDTLETALKCYGAEKDLRGYVAGQGWAHATAHVADLVKFLGRSPQLAPPDQSRIVTAITQRCRTAPAVFAWGEDARMAAALLSLIKRKDFDPAPFNSWFDALTAENKTIWSGPSLDIAAYIHVRNQANMLAQLAARIGAEKPNETPEQFRASVNRTLSALN